MTRLHHEIEINAPVEKVWAILADLESVQLYNPLVKSTRYTSSNKHGVGAARHCDFTPSGFSDERVTEWKPNKVHGMEIVKSSWPMTFCKWHSVLTPRGSHTVLSQETEYEIKFGILGKLMDMAIMRRKLDKTLFGILLRLKKFAESDEKRHNK